MKRHLSSILLLLALTCVLGLTGCGSQASETSATAQQINYTEQTIAAVDKLVNWDYSGFYGYFDKNLKDELSQSALQAAWTDVVTRYGTFDYYTTDISLTAKDGYQIADVPCVFKRGSVTLRLTWNSSGEICGFFITDNTSVSNSLQLANDSEVTFGSEAYPITGSLTMPEGEGPFPAVILIHGSGATDRNEQIGPNLPFMDLAQQLSAQGIAVLRYDKRTYLYPTEMAALDGLTVQDETIDDVVAALAFLKTKNTIQSDQIYIAGHSLGGYLMPRIAEQTPDAAGYIMLAASARPMEELILEQTSYILGLEKDLDAASKEKILQQTQERVAAIQSLTADSDVPAEQLMNVPASYWLDLQNYNPLTEVQNINKPLLFLQGARDYQVTTTDFNLWKEAVESAPDMNATMQLYDNLNHLFMTGTGKSTPAEYQQKGTFSTDASDTIADFIKTCSAE